MKSSRSLPIAPYSAPTASRRGLLKALAGTGAVSAIALSSRRSQASTTAHSDQVLIPTADLKVGDVYDFSYPADHNTAFLVRLPKPALGGVGQDEDIVAFLRSCPHMGCEIQTLQIEKSILGPCGCHRSRFDLSRAGQQIIGRASQNLVQVTLKIEQDMIVATGVIGLPFGDALHGEG